MPGIITRMKNAIQGRREKEMPPVYFDNLLAVLDPSSGIYPKMDMTELVNACKGWVYACVRIIADAIARANLRLYAQKGDDVIELVEHPFLDLLRRVNPYMNARELRVLTASYLELTGNAYWYVPRNRLGVPAEIWVLPSQHIRIIPDPKTFIAGYIYRPNTPQEVRFEPDEIVHFKYPNPADPYYGQSPLQAVAMFVDIDEYMSNYQLALFRNQARPDGVLETEARLDNHAIEVLRREWERLHRGTNKAGRVAILQGGLKYKPITTAPRDLDYIEGHRFVRDAICHILGVPPSKLGIVEDVNRANAEANDWTFQRETILPKLRLMEEKINERILPLYDKRLFCRFDDPTPEDWERILRERETNLKLGVTTINEERQRQGLDPVPWGKTPWLPINMLPVGSGGNTTGNEEGEEGKAKHKEQDNTAIEEQRQAYREALWKRYIATLEPLEKVFIDKMKEYFERERKQVLRNLRRLSRHRAAAQTKIDETDIDFILLPWGEEDKILRDMTRPMIYQAYKSGAMIAISEIGIDRDVTLNNPRVQEFLENKAFKITVINDTTERALRNTLIEGIREGESIDKLADRVQEVFDFAERYRAVRIARTETIEASNYGAMMVYEESNVVEMIEWVTALDERTCEECWQANGEVTRLGEPFPSTGIEAPPHHPNCRCTIAPIIE